MLVNVDDELIHDVMQDFDLKLSPSELINEAVTVFVRIQAARELAALGGMAPEMRDIPR